MAEERWQDGASKRNIDRSIDAGSREFVSGSSGVPEDEAARQQVRNFFSRFAFGHGDTTGFLVVGDMLIQKEPEGKEVDNEQKELAAHVFGALFPEFIALISSNKILTRKKGDIEEFKGKLEDSQLVMRVTKDGNKLRKGPTMDLILSPGGYLDLAAIHGLSPDYQIDEKYPDRWEQAQQHAAGDGKGRGGDEADGGAEISR